MIEYNDKQIEFLTDIANRWLYDRIESSDGIVLLCSDAAKNNNDRVYRISLFDAETFWQLFGNEPMTIDLRPYREPDTRRIGQDDMFTCPTCNRVDYVDAHKCQSWPQNYIDQLEGKIEAERARRMRVEDDYTVAASILGTYTDIMDAIIEVLESVNIECDSPDMATLGVMRLKAMFGREQTMLKNEQEMRRIDLMVIDQLKDRIYNLTVKDDDGKEMF